MRSDATFSPDEDMRTGDIRTERSDGSRLSDPPVPPVTPPHQPNPDQPVPIEEPPNPIPIPPDAPPPPVIDPPPANHRIKAKRSPHMPTATPPITPSAAPEPMTRVARAADLADQSITKATIGGTDIVLARDGETIGAFAATCPHAGAPLEQGALCNHRLICPWHKSVFDLRDGAIIEPPRRWKRLTRYPVRIENGDVLVSARPIR